jgi:hypothetical protein
MKIIKRGLNGESKSIKATCDHCGCVFQFLPNEAKWFDDPRRDGDGWNVKCPQCAAQNFVCV